MIEYDSDFYNLTHVPFIIELPTLCYRVLVPMSKAQLNDCFPYFDLIQVSISPKGAKPRHIKNIGFKCLDFRVFSSGFGLICNDGTKEIFHEHHDVSVERVTPDPAWSLDVNPATGYEAFGLYNAYQNNN